MNSNNTKLKAPCGAVTFKRVQPMTPKISSKNKSINEAASSKNAVSPTNNHFERNI
jgi:hypothetical protein